jgi:hypothetical protein
MVSQPSVAERCAQRTLDCVVHPARRIGGRGTCTPAERHAVNYVAGQMRRPGVRGVYVEAFRGAASSQPTLTPIAPRYHDQGHIPVKISGFERVVNVTLGLPIICTSVDHGTAFDIAWQWIASEGSLVEAIRLAAQFKAIA